VEVKDRFGARHRTIIPLGRGVPPFLRLQAAWTMKGPAPTPVRWGKEKAMTEAVRITELDGLRENFAY